ncbi:hypothetical protein, conserved [Leishmania tarentolae]|uniref:Uncharacterized protein n=1 Tax=Leishmania tarentolae TaxID=5689 RepID=A0A640KG18_LEITA|nr:hypothetical protein, conserved [Leishmania tarentolae]
MPAVITVHPSVLLSIVDHVTRVCLEGQQQLPPLKQSSAPDATAAAPSPAPAFLSTSGLLMGITKVSGPADPNTCGAAIGNGGATTTLCASIELPLQLRPTDGGAVTVAPFGSAALLQHVLREKTDWAAAEKHCKQLSAVMPEVDVVGCYIVCAGARCMSTRSQRDGGDGGGSQRPIGGAAKKATGEPMMGADSIAAIANCVQEQLRNTSMLPPTATRFVLLVVYDNEVTNAVSDAATPATARLPFEGFYVPVTTASDTLSTEEVIVSPSDMEWIALANHTITPADHHGFTVTSSTAVKPGLLSRFCSAAFSTSEAPAASEAAATESSRMASLQNCRAAEELIGSLRLIMRFLVEMTVSRLSTTATAPDDVELLRAVATCLRNVPDSRPSQPPGEETAPSALPSEELLSAVLALEVQCALHMRSLSEAQQRLLRSSRFPMASFDSKAFLPKAGISPQPPTAEGWPKREHDKRSSTNTAAPGHICK